MKNRSKGPVWRHVKPIESLKGMFCRKSGAGEKRLAASGYLINNEALLKRGCLKTYFNPEKL